MLKWIGSGFVAFLLGTTAVYAVPGQGAGAAASVAASRFSGATPAALVAANSTGDIVTLQPPAAKPYLWSASKAADGSVSLAGDVPSEEVRDTLIDQIGNVSNDATSLAGGAPDNFGANATAALDVLGALDSGRVAFDGTSWSVTGSVDSTDKGKAASTAFDASPLKDAGATYDVSLSDATAASAAAPSADNASSAATPADASTPSSDPAAPSIAPNAGAVPPAAAGGAAASAAGASQAPATNSTPPATAAAVAPADYTWTAEKQADGSVMFTGSVPDAKFKAYLSGRIHAGLTDDSTIAQGAPAVFLTDVASGLDALTALEFGQLSFAGGHWMLSGTAHDASAAKAAKDAVSQLDANVWQVDVSVESAPVDAPFTAAAAPGPMTSPPAAPAPAAAPPAATPPAAAPAPAVETPAPMTSSAAAPAVSPPVAAPVSDYVFAATKAAGAPIALTGDVPDQVVKDNFGHVAGDVATGELDLKAHPPEAFMIAALGGITALRKLDTGKLSLADGKWSLTGSASTPELHDSIVLSIANLPNGKQWAVEIAGPPPLAVCQAKLDSLAKAGNAVNFVSGTRFAKGADGAIDGIAAVLALCPDARVDVAGSTDSDGNADANMALSVARAEAVVAELVKRGIKPARLYAIGYGETLPLVPNTTRANKAKNRRIDIKVEDVKP